MHKCNKHDSDAVLCYWNLNSPVVKVAGEIHTATNISVKTTISTYKWTVQYTKCSTSAINLQNAHKLCCIHARIPYALVAITSSMKIYQCTIKGIYLSCMQFSIINTTSVAKVWVSQSVSLGTNAIRKYMRNT